MLLALLVGWGWVVIFTVIDVIATVALAILTEELFHRMAYPAEPAGEQHRPVLSREARDSEWGQ